MPDLRRMMIWLALPGLLAGCGGGPQPERQAASSATPTGSASVAGPTAAPEASASVARSSGAARAAAARADDVNGDGRADLVVEVDLPRVDVHDLVIVHGSAQGLDRRRRTVVPSKTFWSWLIDVGVRADLDGDGFGDILGYGRASDAERMRPHIFWGGPRGIDTGLPPTPIPLPGQSDVASYRTVAGDFNGDGAADVAMSTPSGQNDTSLTILYGPFTRAGVAARESVQPSPTGSNFWRMTVDRIDGRRATGLIVYQGDDGEQTSGWLLDAGPGGLAKEGRRLNKGMAAAFGDFDGDGTRDVAVGDDGSRNDEPGYETEAPSVDKTLTVYYGDGRTHEFTGTAGQAVAGDFNGDGRDDLAFGGARRPIRVFWGGTGGLRAGGGIAGVGGAAPLAAGDYDGDGDDELALATRDNYKVDDYEVIVTDGRKVLSRFDL
ncbi:FG-GAP repeat domain-containing protein [Nonomuraea glycinis]|uniref:FG-GAP repeat domain-containing protein n=1 Tax=Nonomuraea glycinis TaxID=2047744 RepID=UPI002E10F444|nr:VCBS repeat-containing protein [Nonomuraea glycinis]